MSDERKAWAAGFEPHPGFCEHGYSSDAPGGNFHEHCAACQKDRGDRLESEARAAVFAMNAWKAEAERLRELALEMQPYVPEYFAEKWDLTVERIRGNDSGNGSENEPSQPLATTGPDDGTTDGE